MQIISGKWRGKKLISPPSEKVRPTAAKAREALFNVLESHTTLNGKTVADLFAGSGALGIEALSRGAQKAIFVDTDLRPCKKNIHLLGLEEESVLLKRDVLALREDDITQADLIFMDPPYGQNLATKTLAAIGPSLKENAFIFIETESDLPTRTLPFAAPETSFELLKEKTHGAAKLVLLLKT